MQKPISPEHTRVLQDPGQWFPFNKYFPQGHFTSARQLFKGNRRAGWLRGLFRPLYPKKAHLTQKRAPILAGWGEAPWEKASLAERVQPEAPGWLQAAGRPPRPAPTLPFQLRKAGSFKID